MNYKRAKEIIASEVMADVTYKGSNVYLESADEVNNTVRLHFVDTPQTKLDIPVANLIEH
jgi:small acid-soluble spore protein H (minor)